MMKVLKKLWQTHIDIVIENSLSLTLRMSRISTFMSTCTLNFIVLLCQLFDDNDGMMMMMKMMMMMMVMMMKMMMAQEESSAMEPINVAVTDYSSLRLS